MGKNSEEKELKKNESEKVFNEFAQKLKDYMGDNKKRAGFMVLIDEGEDGEPTAILGFLRGMDSIIVPAISKMMEDNKEIEKVVKRASSFHTFLRDPQAAIDNMLKEALSRLRD